MLRKIVSTLLLLLLMFSLPGFSHASTISPPQRISGADRFEVAVNISKQGWPDHADTVILVNYNAFADALSASPLAYKDNAPILLTQADKLTAVTQQEIARLKPTKVVIIGGEGSVSKAVFDQVHSMVSDVERIGGANRFAVSYQISKDLPNTTAVVANGLKFPDALSIAPYAAKNGYPILLTQADKIPDQTAAGLKGKQKTIVSGGPASVSDSILNSLPGHQRIGGADRFEVGVNIIKNLQLPTDKVYVATGLTFADALSGSVLAAKDNAPLLLTAQNSVPDSVKNLILSAKITNFVILGGTGSVSDKVATDLVTPLPLYGKTIVVDPGHGGKDSGAIGNGMYEKNMNLEFAKIFGAKLTALGANVIYTRTDDTYYSLQERASFSNSKHPDLFISIHHDASFGGNSHGLSTYYSTYRPGIDQTGVFIKYQGATYDWLAEDTPNQRFLYNDNGVKKYAPYVGSNSAMAYDTNSPSPQALESKDIATILAQSAAIPQIQSRGTFDQNLYVTRWTNTPSVLIELGFITNVYEMQYLEDPAIKEQRAQKMAQSIADYFSSKTATK